MKSYAYYNRKGGQLRFSLLTAVRFIMFIVFFIHEILSAAYAGDCKTVCSGGSCTSECPSESVAVPPSQLPGHVTVVCRTANGTCSFAVPNRLPSGTPCHCGGSQGSSD
jgi:hypothetical protein